MSGIKIVSEAIECGKIRAAFFLQQTCISQSVIVALGTVAGKARGFILIVGGGIIYCKGINHWFAGSLRYFVFGQQWCIPFRLLLFKFFSLSLTLSNRHVISGPLLTKE